MRKIAGVNPHSIRLRLVAAFALIALLTSALAGGLGLARAYMVTDQYEAEYLAIYGDMAATQALSLLTSPDASQEQLQEVVKQISQAGDLRVRIFAANGDELADSGSPVAELIFSSSNSTPIQTPSLLTVDKDNTLLRGTPLPSVHFSFNVITNTPRSDKLLKLTLGESSNPVGWVEVSECPDMVVRSLANLREAFLTAATVAVVVALAAGWIAGSRLSAPLLELARTAGKMSSGSLEARAYVSSKDELGFLAEQFNHMAEQLQTSFAALQAERDSLRRFVADASHELRTPLTTLRMYTELLQSSGSDDPATRREFLAENEAQIERLTWITENLLDLSRIDAGIAQLNIEACPVDDLLSAVRHEFQPRAVESGIELQVRPSGNGAILQCDRARMEMVLSNLLDNAFKFTPRGGRVELGGEADSSGVSLWVSDTGRGISTTDLPHLFEPFYRGRDRSITGSGLGLAIVKSLVELHGGQVQVNSVEGQGAKFSLWLPEQPERSPSTLILPGPMSL